MKKNRLLSAALVLCTISKIFFVMLLTTITLVLLHWHISPETYKDVVVTVDATNDVQYVLKHAADLEFSNTEWGGTLAQISKLSLYVHYLQTVGHFLLLILILNQISRIIRSVKALETFREENSQAFRKIGIYCVAISLLTSIKWFEMNLDVRMSFSLGFISLAFALGAFILAEIFKEGNKLYEAEQLTI